MPPPSIKEVEKWLNATTKQRSKKGEDQRANQGLASLKELIGMLKTSEQDDDAFDFEKAVDILDRKVPAIYVLHWDWLFPEKGPAPLPCLLEYIVNFRFKRCRLDVVGHDHARFPTGEEERGEDWERLIKSICLVFLTFISGEEVQGHGSIKSSQLGPFKLFSCQHLAPVIRPLLGPGVNLDGHIKRILLETLAESCSKTPANKDFLRQLRIPEVLAEIIARLSGTCPPLFTLAALSGKGADYAESQSALLLAGILVPADDRKVYLSNLFSPLRHHHPNPKLFDRLLGHFKDVKSGRWPDKVAEPLDWIAEQQPSKAASVPILGLKTNGDPVKLNVFEHKGSQTFRLRVNAGSLGWTEEDSDDGDGQIFDLYYSTVTTIRFIPFTETKTRICIATTAQPFCESSVAVKKREAHDLEIVCGRTEGEKIKRLLKFRNLSVVEAKDSQDSVKTSKARRGVETESVVVQGGSGGGEEVDLDGRNRVAEEGVASSGSVGAASTERARGLATTTTAAGVAGRDRDDTGAESRFSPDDAQDQTHEQGEESQGEELAETLPAKDPRLPFLADYDIHRPASQPNPPRPKAKRAYGPKKKPNAVIVRKADLPAKEKRVGGETRNGREGTGRVEEGEEGEETDYDEPEEVDSHGRKKAIAGAKASTPARPAPALPQPPPSTRRGRVNGTVESFDATTKDGKNGGRDKGTPKDKNNERSEDQQETRQTRSSHKKETARLATIAEGEEGAEVRSPASCSPAEFLPSVGLLPPPTTTRTKGGETGSVKRNGTGGRGGGMKGGIVAEEVEEQTAGDKQRHGTRPTRGEEGREQGQAQVEGQQGKRSPAEAQKHLANGVQTDMQEEDEDDEVRMVGQGGPPTSDGHVASTPIKVKQPKPTIRPAPPRAASPHVAAGSSRGTPQQHKPVATAAISTPAATSGITPIDTPLPEESARKQTTAPKHQSVVDVQPRTKPSPLKPSLASAQQQQQSAGGGPVAFPFSSAQPQKHARFVDDEEGEASAGPEPQRVKQLRTEAQSSSPGRPSHVAQPRRLFVEEHRGDGRPGGQLRSPFGVDEDEGTVIEQSRVYRLTGSNLAAHRHSQEQEQQRQLEQQQVEIEEEDEIESVEEVEMDRIETPRHHERVEEQAEEDDEEMSLKHLWSKVKDKGSFKQRFVEFVQKEEAMGKTLEHGAFVDTSVPRSRTSLKRAHSAVEPILKPSMPKRKLSKGKRHKSPPRAAVLPNEKAGGDVEQRVKKRPRVSFAPTDPDATLVDDEYPENEQKMFDGMVKLSRMVVDNAMDKKYAAKVRSYHTRQGIIQQAIQNLRPVHDETKEIVRIAQRFSDETAAVLTERAMAVHRLAQRLNDKVKQDKLALDGWDAARKRQRAMWPSPEDVVKVAMAFQK